MFEAFISINKHLFKNTTTDITYICRCALNAQCTGIYVGRLKTWDPTSRDHQNCGEWHHETAQRGTISQGWTSRDL